MSKQIVSPILPSLQIEINRKGRKGKANKMNGWINRHVQTQIKILTHIYSTYIYKQNPTECRQWQPAAGSWPGLFLRSSSNFTAGSRRRRRAQRRPARRRRPERRPRRRWWGRAPGPRLRGPRWPRRRRQGRRRRPSSSPSRLEVRCRTERRR